MTERAYHYSWTLNEHQCGANLPTWTSGDGMSDFYRELLASILVMLEGTGGEWVFQLEKGKEAGRLHFQGYLHFTRGQKRTVGGVIRMFEGLRGACHTSVSIASTSAVEDGALARYASKKETSLEGPWWSSSKFMKKTLKSTRAGKDKKRKAIELIQMLPWQKNLIDGLDREPDDRHLYWYWSKEGRTGKSTLCQWLCLNRDAVLLSAGNKAGDILNVYKQQEEEFKIILFDLPRSMSTAQEEQTVAALEQLKNGRAMVEKYKGGLIDQDPPHIVVFANRPPKRKLLSADRWWVVEITEQIPEDRLEVENFWVPGDGVPGVALDAEDAAKAEYVKKRKLEKEIEEKEALIAKEAKEAAEALMAYDLWCEEKLTEETKETKKPEDELPDYDMAWKNLGKCDGWYLAEPGNPVGLNPYNEWVCISCGHKAGECECWCKLQGAWAHLCFGSAVASQGIYNGFKALHMHHECEK